MSKLLSKIIKTTIKEAIIVIINSSIVFVSPYTYISEWIVMTNARAFHNN